MPRFDSDRIYLEARRRARDLGYTWVGLNVLAVRAVATRVRTSGPSARRLVDLVPPLESAAGHAPATVRRWLAL